MCLFEYDQEKHLRDTYEEGVEDGIEIGEAQGEKRGSEQAMQLANQLTQSLLQDNRIDDLSRSTRDVAYREALLKEYKLI